MSLFYRIVSEQHLSSGRPPIVLLHGLFGMSDNLMGLADHLGQQYCVVVPDLINHGRSPHRMLMNYPSMAADIDELLDQLGFDHCVIVGHSMGGKVAMQLALSSPHRVRALVVADIAPVAYGDRHGDILQAMAEVARTDISQRKQADNILSRYVAEAALRAFFMKNMARDENGMWRWRFGLKEITHAYSSLSAAPVATGVYQAPCLFIKGQASDYILAEHEGQIKKLFPAAELKIVQGAGHWLHAEKPAAFNRIVERFIAGIAGED